MTVSMRVPGLIVANYGRHFLVESDTGERRICHSRGKKSQGVVGDQVLWLASEDEGTIEKIEPRRNLFYRQDEVRTKSFAANLDQVLILLAAEPEFSASQLSRALIAAEEQHITPIIALNKSDLAEPFARAWTWLQPYRDMGYDVLPLALAHNSEADRAALLQRLDGKTTLVLGPSGAGKSTLINCLIPGALAQTGVLSQALNAGKHTTTSTTWYWVDVAKTTALLDSPGFQEFGLNHIDPAQLAAYMPDLKPHVAQCKFYNCSHLHEPGCGVMAAVKSAANPEEISANRYKIYSELYAELKQVRHY
ncbi:MAG: ribosome small subunit-dependent GTPase A [Rhodoferax sp.]|nr:ribosome small subunit-dependent GTPase A [Rhodoferax sp.]OIP20677.1 MAG: ribosome small subunit-dependent GTPase A [Comamonadaceae bacterium CG2_30_60_41]PIW10152.1 MAG: ribosome small subunit-dependent GTPase A [Comamonadaceae bacterium CG17_big_fil_post_rev_8_21_14_2_50_60_13]PIY23596.1 MAG: ribosome small subunit-dependent GTPase A [Comamonadaceae bacterium CG_4_10_14_3_um_filter_60_75]PJC12136.1 MAG: ribosome small subunit-dependent GTPase A [Comamonadaceae bacterium CG_4_9_14_0_8_um_fi